MKNLQLAREFLIGATKGTGSNMFIEGNAIYSWGRHWPIAVRLDPKRYLFNKEKYPSSSTSKHTTYVRWALEGKPDVEVLEVSKEQIDRAARMGGEVFVVSYEKPVVLLEDVQGVLEQFFKFKGLKRHKYEAKRMSNKIEQLLLVKGL